MHPVAGVDLRHRRLRHDGQRARLPAVDVGAMVQQHRVRRLHQVRAQADLVAHRAGQNPQRSLFTGHLGDSVLEAVDAFVAGLVVEVVLEGCVDDGLVVVSQATS